MQLVGFRTANDGSYLEFLPHNEQFNSDIEKRAIFFNLFNMYMDKTYQFSKKEIDQPSSLRQTFKQKIISLIDISCIQPFTPQIKGDIRIDVASSLLIHAYFTGKSISFPLAIKPFLPVGKLISLIYTPRGLSLMLDLDDMFLHLVYERIKKVNHYADVLLFEKSIIIKDKREGVPNSMVIPSYKKIEKKHLYHDKFFIKQMSIVAETLNMKEIKHIYLVYPKHPYFEKYINIKLPYQTFLNENEYKVKVMPYSFSFCTKSKRKKRFLKLT